MFWKKEAKNHKPVFVYSSDYNMDLGAHVFPSVKFGYIYLKLVDDKRFRKHSFVEPEPITREHAMLVHDQEYVQDLLSLNNSKRLYRSELPLTRPIVDAFFLGSGGTLTAARKGMEFGSAINLSGGFHHSFGDHAEGFCYLNDVAIAIRVLQDEKKIKNAVIIDLDVHQGNGTARIFENDESVYTFSMHEENNYPLKQKSSLDIGLDSGCPDEEYLTLLSQGLKKIEENIDPDIVFYLGGVDVYEFDTLGGLSISHDGMAERDRMVRDFMPDKPLITVLAGGYAQNTDHTVDLHVQTCEVLAGIK